MARLLVLAVTATVLMAQSGQPASAARTSPAEAFWRAALPDAPMPDAILELLRDRHTGRRGRGRGGQGPAAAHELQLRLRRRLAPERSHQRPLPRRPTKPRCRRHAVVDGVLPRGRGARRGEPALPQDPSGHRRRRGVGRAAAGAVHRPLREGGRGVQFRPVPGRSRRRGRVRVPRHRPGEGLRPGPGRRARGRGDDRGCRVPVGPGARRLPAPRREARRRGGLPRRAGRAGPAGHEREESRRQ
uniref:Uncharacterized protein n=1 Tax=Aegilops tauschii subsp. strangulata TaxID=200361 RepID=A0A453L2J2_AEGTS